jgi:hypothetical protein
MQFIFHQPCQPDSYLGDGRWRSSGHWQLTEKSVVVIAVRLPCGAHLEHAEPRPDQIIRGGVTTVLWRRMMQPIEELDIAVEYTLGAKTDTGDNVSADMDV